MKDRPTLAGYKETASKPLRQATLCFLVRGNEVLLAMKKRGFAQGKWNGAGGKMGGKDKDITEAAVRETFEEIGVTPNSLNIVATLSFYHVGNTEAGLQVTVFLSDKWSGQPIETEEMAPKWFDIKEIPYDEMWEGDKLWLPKVLAGKIIEGDFLFDDRQNLLELDIREAREVIDNV